MPAVQVEPFVGGLEDGSPRPGDADPVDSIAYAVSAGVRRFFRGGESGGEKPVPT